MKFNYRYFIEKNNYAVLLLVALTLLVYANSLTNLFVWDDYLVIVNNNFVRSWKNISLMFSKDYLFSSSKINKFGVINLVGSGESSYRPVCTLTYFADYSLYKLNPFGYHLTNLILHIFNVILLYFLFNLIAKDKKISLLGSALFAVHPATTEVVACIAFREDLLAFLFYICAFILYIKLSNYDRLRRIYYYAMSVVLYLLALFSKEMAITLPLILVLYDYYFVCERSFKQVLINFKSRYAGYIAATLFYLWVFFFPMSNTGEILMAYPGNSFYTNILTMFKVLAVYIRWLFIPINIHATLPIPYFPFVVDSLSRPEAILSILLIVFSLGIAFKIRKTSKLASFAIFWFFVTLIPVLNIFPIGNIMASRYLYIPLVGFCLLVAVLLLKLPSSNIFKEIKKDAVIIILIFYSMFTVIGTLVWKHDVTLWLEIMRYYPDARLVYNNLGGGYVDIGKYDKAIYFYKKATEVDPNDTLAYYNLGVMYGQTGNIKEQIAAYKKAIELLPSFSQAYNNLGAVFQKKGNVDSAIILYEKAIEIYPAYAGAYYNLATAYKEKGQYQLALEYADKAKELGYNDSMLLESLRPYRE
ncbi:MAG: tetratricopeptide repeat protein [Candidatus Omnitrophica bacterium]|nr:tetratricopeptide repeat protein [Candidatus Omnitrophota bacterium]MDD5352855.1 tetratricopeptide repeat protein [Candidatus Omnitrophota bacterium]MDD5550454.1 tetratricopeptide repeat protein [Candidatus Omnitrophota bacterium]